MDTWMPLRMLKVIEQSSNICLFSKQWKWNPHAHVEGINALIQTFTQFAREIDGGNVVRVHFDTNPCHELTLNNGNDTPLRRNTNERRPSTIEQSHDANASTGPLEMLSHQGNGMQIVLFVDHLVSDGVRNHLQLVLVQILDSFVTNCIQEIGFFRSRLESTDAPLPSQQLDVIQQHMESMIEHYLLPMIS